MSNKKKIIISVAIGIMLIAAVFALYIFNPDEVAIFPQCPFLLTTGYKCPGCGTQRALHSLFHLRFVDALKYNSFMFFAIPLVFTGAYFEYLGGKQRHPKLVRNIREWTLPYRKWSAAILFGVIIIYWIVRNL